MKRTFVLVTVLCLVFSCCSVALAAIEDEVATCADPIIASASISLNGSGIAYFNVTVYREAETIKVSSCSLQKLVNGSWISAGSLPVPSVVRVNTRVYSASKDYSNYCIDNFSYRIVVTYNIDGYTKSYTSNIASF